MLLSAKAQIIITGAMYDPAGGDAPAVGTANGSYIHKGGYEYIQFMATEDIDFATKPFSVVTCINTGTLLAVDPTKGWAVGGTRSRKFNLVSGTAAKGTFFYVGGPEKTIAGYVTISSVYTPTLDISSSNWIRTIPYSDGSTNTDIFDGFGYSTTGLFPNSGANPVGIAVFAGTNVAPPAKPIDAIFIATANPISNNGVTYAGGGYTMPDNDRYESSAFFGSSTKNKYGFVFQDVAGFTADFGNFLKLGGVYDLDSKTWTTPRSANYVTLVPTKDAAGVAFATLSMIEGAGATVLPVKLASFTAIANKQGFVNLAWATASEKDNSHFEVTRSVNGIDFERLDDVKGNGTTATVNNYSYTDNSPAAGVNYYQLKQIDFDGKSTLSKVVTAKVGLNQSNIKVLANKTSITVNYQALANGKASFTVYSVSGAKLATVQQNVNVGANQLSIPVQLGNSLHLLKVVQGSESVSVKF
ncbi:hypothetical protein MASR2M52_18970 [Pedobacter sp.]